MGGYEYRLAEPDYALAQKILAMSAPPLTEPHLPASSSPASVVDGGSGVKPQYIIGYDDRIQTGSTAYWPQSAVGELDQVGGPWGTAALIGRSTSFTAAHAVYDNGAWISMNGIAWSAYNDPINGPTEPWGRWQPDSVTVPAYWACCRDFNWDFAVVEWGPSNAPGDQVGWFGTEQNQAGTQQMYAYSGDKPYLSQWWRFGDYWSLEDARYHHGLDIVPGDSGGCIYNSGYYCTGIQSTQMSNSTGDIWNEARRWDSATYNFFHAYGNWP